MPKTDFFFKGNELNFYPALVQHLECRRCVTATHSRAAAARRAGSVPASRSSQTARPHGPLHRDGGFIGIAEPSRGLSGYPGWIRQHCSVTGMDGRGATPPGSGRQRPSVTPAGASSLSIYQARSAHTAQEKQTQGITSRPHVLAEDPVSVPTFAFLIL